MLKNGNPTYYKMRVFTSDTGREDLQSRIKSNKYEYNVEAGGVREWKHCDATRQLFEKYRMRERSTDNRVRTVTT